MLPFWISVLATGTIYNAVLADVISNPFTAELTDFIHTEMKLWDVPGMSIAVVNGKGIAAEGYGYSTLPNVKATPETLYYAGSTTKAHTAACLSTLITSGQYKPLGWETKISSILGTADFALQNEWATKHLTLDDAVSHRTGLPRHDRSLMRDHGHGSPRSTANIVRNMRNLPFLHEPRTKFIYGNYMYITLSLIIEKLTKKPLGQVMRETIWSPLGMQSTYFGLREVKDKGASSQLATGYLWNNETQKRYKADLMPLTDLSGAAAIISNVRDYARWIQGLLGETQLFSQDVHRDIRKGRMIHIPNNYGAFDVSLYSLGWFRRTFRGRIYFWHDGSIIGFKSLVYWFPNDNFGFVIFANGDDADSSNTNIAWKLISQRFQIPAADVGVDGHWRQQEKSEQQRFQNAVSNIYPDHPSTPPAYKISSLQGVYWNKGFGLMRLVLEKGNPLAPGVHLLAQRPDMTWHYALRLRNVHGKRWIACESWIEDMNNSGQFHPAEFTWNWFQAPRLRIEWRSKGVSEGNVTFTRIA